jgi:long-subunit acyl-CoA synthetase (AMP-forming)
MTFVEYYEASMKFAAALTKNSFTERSGVSILSYNNPEWFVVFNGTIFAN